MTLAELNYNFFKAHLLMGIGTLLGNVVAETQHLGFPLLTGLLTGLLLSIHIYRKCIMALIAEYKRLKTDKNNNENIS